MSGGGAEGQAGGEDDLARWLLSDELRLFFHDARRGEAIDRVWSRPGAPAALEALVGDPAAPGKARLIAAEALFARDLFFIGRLGQERVARLYADALRRGYTENANAWGMPWMEDGTAPAGSRFLILGQAAVPALSELLDDDAVVDRYEGSELATVGNRYRVRVKDVAAYYLGRITRHPVPFHEDPAARDAGIARLREALSAPPEQSQDSPRSPSLLDGAQPGA